MILDKFRTLTRTAFIGATAAVIAVSAPARAETDTIRLDFAYYNPVSLVLKEQGLLEQAFKADGIDVEWVQSHGSNKALEFLNAGGIDFGSTAGAAALLGKINGIPIKSIYVYSRPEWTALVTRPDTGIQKVEDLKGRTVAVTRGTDPYIFLLRSLAAVNLSEQDLNVVLLQHPDGKNALVNGDVDAWAGLDPYMAQAELENDAVLFHRDASQNTWGILNVREEFARENPQLVERVLTIYEQARKWSLEHPDELRAILVKAAKLDDEVAAKQLGERTELTHSVIGAEQRESILAAGLVLQQAGVIKPDVDVTATVDALIDPQYSERVAKKLAASL
ncbi:MAG: aliphatic sulfonate ABC transporter substrate-binding protein [Dongiaceae bacterium]